MGMGMMSENIRLWPHSSIRAVILSLVTLVLLILLLIALRVGIGWPSPASEGLLLLGLFLLSFIPVILVLVDSMMARGGILEFRGLKVDFSNAQDSASALPDVTIPANIGVPSQAVSDSSTHEILDALKQAVGSESVVIDLAEGDAWWETRLLVLLAGAVRHNQPKIIVFVGNESSHPQTFLGWAYASDLLPRLLNAHPRYATIYYRTLAAARQWELVEPSEILDSPPPQPTWFQPGLATLHPRMAFESNLPNPFFAEQLLASELGTHIEYSDAQPRTIDSQRLRSLFTSVLKVDTIDSTKTSEERMESFFKSDKPYIANTDANNQFQSLVSRLSLLNAIVGNLVQKK